MAHAHDGVASAQVAGIPPLNTGGSSGHTDHLPCVVQSDLALQPEAFGALEDRSRLLDGALDPGLPAAWTVPSGTFAVAGRSNHPRPDPGGASNRLHLVLGRLLN